MFPPNKDISNGQNVKELLFVKSLIGNLSHVLLTLLDFSKEEKKKKKEKQAHVHSQGYYFLEWY